ncbi:TP53-binding protein 1-like isoform X2 [Daktulosphaira vitifoliae]|uniref:TP53-binding protein 1-like isoform X2 n=1 Tax=Daktulosphaira vitifoliae TaxID=58002 RepID=UPI0021AA4284|nr:TP53-binding protein 1-like isoform X2 [Daktulosphaira vitifoliae]
MENLPKDNPNLPIDKDMIIISSEQSDFCNVTSSEETWDSHTSRITISKHRNQMLIKNPVKEVNISSVEKLTCSDDKFKLPLDSSEKVEELKTLSDIDYVYCIAAVKQNSSVGTKLLAISFLESLLKYDVKSESSSTSSLNGYIADHSGSSTSSTVCATGEELFLVPKVPRDSFVSISSSSSCSSNGIVLQQIKTKYKKMQFLPKNNTSHPVLMCPRCNFYFPGIKDPPDGPDYKNEGTNIAKCFDLPSKVMTSSNSKNKKKLKKTNKVELKKELLSTKENIEIIDPKEEPRSEHHKLPEINEKLSVSFNIGSKVFAYWISDKLFYPATIIEIIFPKYKVEFLSDHVIKSITEDGLVHSDALRQGMPIGIFDTVSQEYKVGDIVSIHEIGIEDKNYTVDLDSEVVDVSFEKLVLNIEQAKCIQEKTLHNNVSNFSPRENFDGKRIRLSRSTNTKKQRQQIESKTGEETNKRKKNKLQTDKKRKCLFPLEKDPRDIPSTSTGITESIYHLSPQYSSQTDSDFDHIREELTTVDMFHLKDSQIDSDHSSVEKSPIKIDCNESTKIVKVFSNLSFVISYSKYKRRPMPNDSDQSSDNEFDSSPDYFAPSVIHKKSLIKQITKFGGAIYRCLNLVPKNQLKSCFLITDTPSHTCNYFLSIALGVPAYHHNYIQQAIEQKKIFTEVIIGIQPLPNGWSLELKKMIFRSSETNRSKIFAGYIIYIALAEKPSRLFWAGLLKFTGAIVYTSWKNGVKKPLTSHIVVILTDSQCPAILQKCDFPKLSITWVIQSLICESVRPIDGHEHYIEISDTE